MTSASMTGPGIGAAAGHYGFGQVARMEWIKLRSVRSTWWLQVFIVLGMIGSGIGVGAGYRSHVPVATAAQIVNNALGGAVLAQLLIGALGVLAVTGEYSSGMVRSTFAAIPRRSLVLAAKMTTFGLVAFAVGEVASLAAFVAGQAAISGSPVPRASLADPSVLRPVLLTGAYLAVVGLLGLGLGTVIRHTGGAIGVLFGALFVPMFLAALFGPAGIAVVKFVPLFILINSVAVVTPVPDTLSAWAGMGVLCGYAAVVLAVGRWLLVRRDA
jgi:ABC-2 type transport system permease protein